MLNVDLICIKGGIWSFYSRSKVEIDYVEIFDESYYASSVFFFLQVCIASWYLVIIPQIFLRAKIFTLQLHRCNSWVNKLLPCKNKKLFCWNLRVKNWIEIAPAAWCNWWAEVLLILKISMCSLYKMTKVMRSSMERFLAPILYKRNSHSIVFVSEDDQVWLARLVVLSWFWTKFLSVEASFSQIPQIFSSLDN